MFLVPWSMKKSYYQGVDVIDWNSLQKKKKVSGDITIIIIILFSLFWVMLSLYVKPSKAIKNVSRDWKFTPS